MLVHRARVNRLVAQSVSVETAFNRPSSARKEVTSGT